MIETPTDLLLPILSKLTEAVERIEATQKAQFALIQQQLGMIEPQLNTMTIWASRSYTANLDPAARSAVLEEAKKVAEELAAQEQAKEDALLAERANRGIGKGGDAVTSDDEAWWRDDRER